MNLPPHLQHLNSETLLKQYNIHSNNNSNVTDINKTLDKNSLHKTNKPNTSNNTISKSKLMKKKWKVLRKAGGKVWEDPSMDEWPENDFRLFCGDLGNEVTDEILSNAFRKYKSFNKGRVIRDKRTSKTKGYGFVSFANADDFIKAMREMNGKYVGNRPIRLKRSDWKERSQLLNKSKLENVKFMKKAKIRNKILLSNTTNFNTNNNGILENNFNYMNNISSNPNNFNS